MNTRERLEKLMGRLLSMRDAAIEDRHNYEAAEFGRAAQDARQILAELPSCNPWEAFLEARSDVIANFVVEKRTWEGIAGELRIDEQQVRRIYENHAMAEKLEEGAEVPVFEAIKPVTRDEAIDCAASNLAKVDVTRKILTVFEAFPAGLKGLTAEEILAQIRKIVGFGA